MQQHPPVSQLQEEPYELDNGPSVARSSHQAMPPPLNPPDSQGSHSSALSSAGLATSPSNAYAPTSDDTQHTPPSSFTQPLSSDNTPVAPLNHALPSGSPTAPSEHAYKATGSGASSPSSRVSGSPTQGSKRTASGAVKLPEPTSAGFYAKPRVATGHHSRNTSVASNASSVSELSAQLRTRLTYAMVKVQNGWEKNSIAEVENLASSQLSSPVSASTPNMTMHSPRASLVANANRRSRELTQVVGVGNHNNAARPGTSQSTQSLQSEPYEMHNHHQPPRSNGIPMLAPAPELKSYSASRRTNSRDIHPPPLLKSRPPQLATQYSAGAATSASSTPRAGGAATPTPQEQDAVDTLLFMSSPANSSHFPHHRHQHQHHRGNASVSSSRATPLSLHEPTATDHAAKRRSLGMAFRTERDVDRLLDQMADMQSSSDDASDGAEGRALAGDARQRPHQQPHPPPRANGVVVNVNV